MLAKITGFNYAILTFKASLDMQASIRRWMFMDIFLMTWILIENKLIYWNPLEIR